MELFLDISLWNGLACFREQISNTLQVATFEYVLIIKMYVTY